MVTNRGFLLKLDLALTTLPRAAALACEIGCSVWAERIVRRKFWGFWAPAPPIFSKSQSDPQKAVPYVKTRVLSHLR